MTEPASLPHQIRCVKGHLAVHDSYLEHHLPDGGVATVRVEDIAAVIYEPTQRKRPMEKNIFRPSVVVELTGGQFHRFAFRTREQAKAAEDAIKRVWNPDTHHANTAKTDEKSEPINIKSTTEDPASAKQKSTTGATIGGCTIMLIIAAAVIALVVAWCNGGDDEPRLTRDTVRPATILTLPPTRPTTTAALDECNVAMAHDFASFAKAMSRLTGTVTENTGRITNADSIFADSMRVCGSDWPFNAVFAVALSGQDCQPLSHIYLLAPSGSRVEELAFEAWAMC